MKKTLKPEVIEAAREIVEDLLHQPADIRTLLRDCWLDGEANHQRMTVEDLVSALRDAGVEL
jgi:hypothetical protein